MKYLIMIFSNPESRRIWEQFSDAERERGWAEHFNLVDDLAASGELVAVHGLVDPSRSKRVFVRDGVTVATDGPFAESKEYLAGFFVVECESIERAVEHAGRIPEAAHGLVEVRPVIDASGPTGRFS